MDLRIYNAVCRFTIDEHACAYETVSMTLCLYTVGVIQV